MTTYDFTAGLGISFNQPFDSGSGRQFSPWSPMGVSVPIKREFPEYRFDHQHQSQRHLDYERGYPMSMTAHTSVVPQQQFHQPSFLPHSIRNSYHYHSQGHPQEHQAANTKRNSISAPSSPSSARRPLCIQTNPIPQREFFEGGYVQPRYPGHQHHILRSNASPYVASDFMHSPNESRYQFDSTSPSSSSYYYQTPSISTPYSEASPFPTPTLYSPASLTPLESRSPDEMRLSQQKHSRISQSHSYEDDDEMPLEPYVAKVKTNYPPKPPRMPRRHTENMPYPVSGRSPFKEDNAALLLDLESAESSELYKSLSNSPQPEHKSRSKKVTYSRWTQEEDILLKKAIAKYGDGKWSLISNCVPGRTPMQCSTRWQGALNTTIHKGKWEPEEDAILIRAVQEWQQFNSQVHESEEDFTRCIPWSNIASLLPRARTGVQALARWSEALDPRITKGKWTSDEDQALLRGVQQHGKCWIKIAACVQGRTQRQCRTRFCQISDKSKKLKRAQEAPAEFPEGIFA